MKNFVLVNLRKETHKIAKKAAVITRRSLAGYVDRAVALQIDADVKSGELPKTFLQEGK